MECGMRSDYGVVDEAGGEGLWDMLPVTMWDTPSDQAGPCGTKHGLLHPIYRRTGS